MHKIGHALHYAIWDAYTMVHYVSHDNVLCIPYLPLDTYLNGYNIDCLFLFRCMQVTICKFEPLTYI